VERRYLYGVLLRNVLSSGMISEDMAIDISPQEIERRSRNKIQLGNLDHIILFYIA
jgi:hypothetical protein